MPATKVNDTVTAGDGEELQFGELVAELPARAWRRLPAGAGAHGPRDYDWARIPIRTGRQPGRGHWLPARRKISDPSKIACHLAGSAASTGWA